MWADKQIDRTIERYYQPSGMVSGLKAELPTPVFGKGRCTAILIGAVDAGYDPENRKKVKLEQRL